jgi:hypothetical protein
VRVVQSSSPNPLRIAALQGHPRASTTRAISEDDVAGPRRSSGGRQRRKWGAAKRLDGDIAPARRHPKPLRRCRRISCRPHAVTRRRRRCWCLDSPESNHHEFPPPARLRQLARMPATACRLTAAASRAVQRPGSAADLIHDCRPGAPDRGPGLRVMCRSAPFPESGRSPVSPASSNAAAERADHRNLQPTRLDDRPAARGMSDFDPRARRSHGLPRSVRRLRHRCRSRRLHVVGSTSPRAARPAGGSSLERSARDARAPVPRADFVHSAVATADARVCCRPSRSASLEAVVVVVCVRRFRF